MGKEESGQWSPVSQPSTNDYYYTPPYHPYYGRSVQQFGLKGVVLGLGRGGLVRQPPIPVTPATREFLMR